MSRVFTLASLLALAACAAQPTHWTRNGAVEHDLKMEQAQCRNQARAIGAGEPNGFAAAAIMQTAYNDCMVGKGWVAQRQ